MFKTSRNFDSFTLFKSNVTSFNLDIYFALENNKKFIFIIMFMPMILTIKFGGPYY